MLTENSRIWRTAIHAAVDAADPSLFIDVRSDVFFQAEAPERLAALLPEAITRGRACAAGLSDPTLIRQTCAALPSPINVMAQTMAINLHLQEVDAALAPGAHAVLLLDRAG